MRKKVGLALGAGGAKGLSHIGILQVIKRENIPIDFIAGSSMGAIVGAAYAAGGDPDFMAKLACKLNQSHFVDVTIPKMGLLKGEKVLEIARLLTHNKDFDQLNIPLSVIATDIERMERVVFKEGNIASAIRASISIPGIFNPVRIDGKLLVDGAVKDRVPISVVKEMGADIVIGVDVNYYQQYEGDVVQVNNIYEVISQSINILESEISKFKLKEADILITPDMRKVAVLDFNKVEFCIEEGKRAAEEKLSGLLKAVGL